MGFFKTVIWTAASVGAGVFLATYEIDGRTSLEHLQRAYRKTVVQSPVEQLKDSIGEALDLAKDRLAGAHASAREKLANRPRERVSPDDRAALNKLIQKRPDR